MCILGFYRTQDNFLKTDKELWPLTSMTYWGCTHCRIFPKSNFKLIIANYNLTCIVFFISLMEFGHHDSSTKIHIRHKLPPSPERRIIPDYNGSLHYFKQYNFPLKTKYNTWLFQWHERFSWPTFILWHMLIFASKPMFSFLILCVLLSSMFDITNIVMT